MDFFHQDANPPRPPVLMEKTQVIFFGLRMAAMGVMVVVHFSVVDGGRRSMLTIPHGKIGNMKSLQS